MHAAPVYEQQPLALPHGCPAGLRLFALRMLPVAFATPPQAQRQTLRSAIDHAAQTTLGAGALLHRPARAPYWPQQPDWHACVAYAWPLALWGVGTGQAWGVDIEAAPTVEDKPQDADIAALYLEPAALARIVEGADFVDQWCALEAQLKCAGLPLTEAGSRPQGWNAALRTAPLGLPPGWGHYRAALAWRADVCY